MTAVFMLVILFYRGQWVRVGLGDIKKLSLVGCLICLHWVAFYAAIKFANISVALVCLSTAGIFTSLIDPFVNNGNHDIKEILIGMLAIVGVYLIYRYQVSFGVGILFGVIAAILSSVFTVLNKKIANKYPARVMVFYEMTTGFIFLSILLPILYHFIPSTNYFPRSTNIFSAAWVGNDWLWIVILSLCCTVWAQSLALNALKTISSFTATLSVNLEPVYGILLAFLFYNENREIIFLKGTNNFNLGFIVGMGLILLSVVFQMVLLLRPGFSVSGFVKEKGGID